MVFIVDGQRIATENFLVGQIYEIIYKNENKVFAMCQGIGSDFVMFTANNPRIITLNLDTAQAIDDIIPAEAGSMYDYNDLINKPTINNRTLIGNLTSSDLGLQTTLNTAQMAAVNSGIDSAKVEQIATNTTAIGNKQDVIDSSHKLSADLVDDSSSTNKFATAAQLSQIGTNETNISKLKYETKSIVLTGTGAVTWSQSGTGQYYSEEITLTEVKTVLGWCLSGFNALDSTAWFMLSQVNTAVGKFRVLSNKNTFPASASLNLRIFGTTDTIS